jgi:glycosyltransferase involved in cell wall biosynthesis
MKAKVLIATYYWPPSGGPGVQRYLKFAKYLPTFDIEPIILTVKNPTYPIQDPTLEQEIPKNLKIYRTRTIEPFGLYAGLSGKKAESIKPTIELEGETFRSSIGSWIRANVFIPDARAGWLITARLKAEDLVRDFNIQTVITTGPPHSVHFIGKHLQQKQNIRWLADFRDPWSQVYYNQILPRTSIAEQVDEKLEKSILSKADEVIVVSRSQAESFRKIVERGYRVITNGFDPEDFKGIKPHDETSKGTLIRHIGNIGEAAVPEAFLKAVKSVSENIDLTVEFIGDNHPGLQKLIHKFKLQEIVSIKEYQPHKIAIQKMAEADILLLSIPDVDDIQHHIPGKLFEYIGTGLPILMLGPVDGDSAEIIKQEDAGIACGFNDLESIKDTIKTLSARSSQNVTPIDPVHHPYSRISLTKTLSDLILEKSG